MLISFILPAYKSKFLNLAIESILNQDYSDFELVIIDDNSPENLFEIVSKFKDERIKYYRNQENIGGNDLVKQWNKCLEYANGDYLVLASDDDIYDKTFLSTGMKLISKYPKVDIIRSRVKLINEEGETIGIDGILEENCSQIEFVYAWLNGGFTVCMANYIMKTEAIRSIQFIQQPFAFGTDIITVFLLAKNGLANYKEMLFCFRFSQIHLSSDNSKMPVKIEATTKLFNKIKAISYLPPCNDIEKFCLNQINWDTLYRKCIYDYYNGAVKFLPFRQIFKIEECELANRKDKNMMYVRFFIDKLFKK
ncbi:hypothetical protein SMI01S_17920 [Sphingobacterium mizutaii NBRC 14946 = DSM 11724]|uniref:Spore coat polysaccharide biosynthesis protein spsA n=2 Tax=Sphingobacterium mizutaii TaxID=1010 RepID=A0AAJ5C0I8_9SPHI|nr:glycosyltransferase family 2 protein [Sphingobacterium mizutaii]GEM68186.1 hypothetical protein SMI01S_17920 [Sphingobacterium mizutaii NBRC 14946 = DSM 11724]SDL09175.1 Glycosyltransferase involved in cell wall bisynthesis [Sphingobacterium mizutaii]SNV51344.1 Spore coat polysaccharide biosynthesis protein spsA [Sphingobacterium mizutaii]